MISAVLLGLGAGIIFSFITGPVFFALLKTSIERGFLAGWGLAIGVICSDILYIGITLFGSQFLDFKNDYEKYIGLIGAPFLLGIGIYYLFSSTKICYQNHDQPQKFQHSGYILKGFLMCVLSPSSLMFWVVVGGIISVKLHDDFNEKILFFFIALCTQFSVDTLKAFYASKLRYRIKEHYIGYLNKIAGIIVIAFAAWLSYKTYLLF